MVALLIFLSRRPITGAHWAAVYNAMGGRERAEELISDGCIDGYIRCESNAEYGTMITLTKRGWRAARRLKRLGLNRHDYSGNE